VLVLIVKGGRPVESFVPKLLAGRSAVQSSHKRRLPVLQNKAPDDAAAEQRPPWQWALIAAGFVITLWIPLTIPAEWLGRHLASRLVDVNDRRALAQFTASATAGDRALLLVLWVGPIAVSFILACLAAGGLVGRFGGRSADREALVGGFAAALLVCGIAALGGALRPWPLAVGSLAALGLVGALSTHLGARLGIRRRPGSAQANSPT
jgi:hypothetical protein